MQKSNNNDAKNVSFVCVTFLRNLVQSTVFYGEKKQSVNWLFTKK